ncbi:MAG: hypothetical protein ACREL7_18995 [Longimicrobiales bacterium]
MLHDDHSQCLNAGSIMRRVAKGNASVKVNGISTELLEIPMNGNITGAARGRPEELCNVNNHKAGGDDAGIVAVRMTVKRLEISQAVVSGFAVLCHDTFCLNRYFNYDGCIVPNALASWWRRDCSCRADGQVQVPALVASGHCMVDLCDNLSSFRLDADAFAVIQKVSYQRRADSIAVSV